MLSFPKIVYALNQTVIKVPNNIANNTLENKNQQQSPALYAMGFIENYIIFCLMIGLNGCVRLCLTILLRCQLTSFLMIPKNIIKIFYENQTGKNY
jgi:hypothetical protein